MRKTIWNWLVVFCCFVLLPYVGYVIGKKKADRWYARNQKDCFYEFSTDGGIHYVCNWKPAETTLVISTNPQIILDTVSKNGCAHVMFEQNKIYIQGIACKEFHPIQ